MALLQINMDSLFTLVRYARFILVLMTTSNESSQMKFPRKLDHGHLVGPALGPDVTWCKGAGAMENGLVSTMQRARNTSCDLGCVYGGGANQVGRLRLVLDRRTKGRAPSTAPSGSVNDNVENACRYEGILPKSRYRIHTTNITSAGRGSGVVDEVAK